MLSFDGFVQLTANGLLNGVLYALVGWAFSLLLHVTGRFHLAFAFTYALSAMVAAQLGLVLDLPWAVAILAGAVVAALAGAAIERFIYRPIAARAGNGVLLAIFVASLGIQIAGVNLLSFIWVGKSTLQIKGFDDGAVPIGPAVVSLGSVVSAVVGAMLLIGAWAVMRYTRAGRITRAVAANEQMSLAVGINPKRVFVIVFAASSFLGGVAAVLSATTTAASPGMGAQPLFYAFIVAFVVRGASVPLTVVAGLVLGLIESWTGLFVSPSWSGIVVFALLLIFVALRPYPLRALLQSALHRKELASGVSR